MTTPQEKAQCVSWLIKTKSDIQAQRNFIAKYVKGAPARQSIRNWHKQFVGTGKLLLKPKSGWSKSSEKGIELIRQSLSRKTQQSPSALLSFGLRERCYVPHQSKRHK